MKPTRDAEVVTHWVHRLFGISVVRQEAAQRRLADWNIDHVRAVLAPGDADGSVAAVLLTEGVDELVGRGAEERRFISKLRRDPDIWPTWAEIRAAAVFARYSPEGARLVVEPHTSGGKRSDFALERESHRRISMEFKAVGLSEQELTFERSMAPLLPALLPRKGLLTMHVADTSRTIRLSRDERRTHRRRAERLSKHLYPQLRAIGAATIVGHGTEDAYALRVSRRFSEACAQLDPADDCWVGFHWSNGATVESVRAALASLDVPPYVAGVALIGSVAIPGRLDNYVVMLPAPFDSREGGDRWESDTDIAGTKAEFGLINESAGVRPTYITVPGATSKVHFLYRSGTRRIHPFNVLLDPDPRPYARLQDPDARARYFGDDPPS